MMANAVVVEILKIRGGQHAGVRLYDERCRPVGDGVEVGFNTGPDVSPYLMQKGTGSTAAKASRAGLDFGDVLLVHRGVIAAASRERPRHSPVARSAGSAVKRSGMAIALTAGSPRGRSRPEHAGAGS